MTDATVRDPAIEVRELTRRFGTFTAVDAISFDVAAGEVFGFLGANGAGKTTTLRAISATSSRRAEGRRAWRDSTWRRRRSRSSETSAT